MYYFFRYFLILFFCGLFLSCSEKVSYTGKIINYDFFDYTTVNNKNEVLNNLGQPNFIDPIEKKYYYYFEKIINKNLFDSRIEKRTMIVFNFEKNEKVQSFNQYNLNQEQKINIIKDKTKNNLIDRGIIEKIFGGIGKQTLSDTSQ